MVRGVMSGAVYRFGPRQILSFLLFFLGGREEDVVQDQAVAGGILVEREIGGRIAHRVLVVLGIVSAVEGEGPLPVMAMDVFGLVGARHLREHGDRGLEEFLLEA